MTAFSSFLKLLSIFKELATIGQWLNFKPNSRGLTYLQSYQCTSGADLEVSRIN